MQRNWAASVGLVFQIETDKYTNRPTDKGGPTKYGITLDTLSRARGITCSSEDVKKLMKSEALAIYKRFFWDVINADELPDGLDYMTFDFYVNSGGHAVKSLQEVLGVKIDGVLGNDTLSAIRAYPTGIQQLLLDYTNARLKFVRGIGGPQGYSKNGRGWEIRITGIDPKGQWANQPGVIGNAQKMLHQQTPTPTNTPASTDASAPARVEDTALTTILKKPEAIVAAVTSLTGLITAAAGNTILSYALAAAIVAGSGMALYLFTQRVRAGGA